MAGPAPRRRLAIFDAQLAFMVVLLGLLALVAYWRGGGELLRSGLGGGADMLLRFGLLIVVSFLAAGVAQALVPRGWIEGALGQEAGFGGIALASAIGVLTPAGPFVSMPLAAVMLRSGASGPAVVAFLTGWSLLAVHRLVAWEIPILGARFALARWVLCLALPLVAGLLARSTARLFEHAPQ
jgi:uncharacterized membrane protein YraQ (UPF0718 family)